MYNQPWMMYPPNGCNSWDDIMKFHEFMRKNTEEFEKKLKEEKDKNKTKAKTYSLMEVFALLILLSPFVGVAQVYVLKNSIHYILEAIK